jgi:hypothetical protein
MVNEGFPFVGGRCAGTFMKMSQTGEVFPRLRHISHKRWHMPNI